MAGSAEAFELFERQTAWPMLVLSLDIIPLLVISLVADLSQGTDKVFLALDWMIGRSLSSNTASVCTFPFRTGRFIWSNVIDLAVVLVPFRRPLRVARSARISGSIRSCLPPRAGQMFPHRASACEA